MNLGPHTLNLLRAPVSEDIYGNETRDWDNAAEATVTGCSVQPAGADEYVIDREAVVVRLRAFLPGNPDVQSTDRARFGDDVYYIDGVEPWLFAQLPHTDLLLRRVEN